MDICIPTLIGNRVYKVDSDGYIYCKNRMCSDVIYYRCIRCTCGRGKFSNGQFIRNKCHSHEPDLHDLADKQFRQACLARCLVEETPFTLIYNEEISKFPGLTVSRTAVEKQMSRLRNKKRHLKSQPIVDSSSVLDTSTFLLRSEDIVFDSGVSSDELRIVTEASHLIPIGDYHDIVNIGHESDHLAACLGSDIDAVNGHSDVPIDQDQDVLHEGAHVEDSGDVLDGDENVESSGDVLDGDENVEGSGDVLDGHDAMVEDDVIIDGIFDVPVIGGDYVCADVTGDVLVEGDSEMTGEADVNQGESQLVSRDTVCSDSVCSLQLAVQRDHCYLGSCGVDNVSASEADGDNSSLSFTQCRRIRRKLYRVLFKQRKRLFKTNPVVSSCSTVRV